MQENTEGWQAGRCGLRPRQRVIEWKKHIHKNDKRRFNNASNHWDKSKGTVE